MPPAALSAVVSRAGGERNANASGCRPWRRSTPSSSPAPPAGVLIARRAIFLSAAPPDNYFAMGLMPLTPDAIAQWRSCAASWSRMG